MEPKAAPPAQDAWFRPVGDSEILMAVGAMLTVEVRAQVPVDAPAGSTTLKLRAVDEAEPERLTDGPRASSASARSRSLSARSTDV